MDSKNTAQHPIFISHSSKDKTYARKLENELRHRDFNVWVDDQGLRRSTRWPAKLEQAIKACSVLIVILTPNVSDSDTWVSDEIAVAKKLGILIFRLLLEGKEYFSLNSSQYTDVTNGQIPAGIFFETLSNTIASIASPKPKKKALDVTSDDLGKKNRDAIFVRLVVGLGVGLVVGIFVGFVVGLIAGLGIGLAVGIVWGIFVGIAVGIYVEPKVGLVVAIVAGLGMGLVMGLFTWFVVGPGGLYVWDWDSAIAVGLCVVISVFASQGFEVGPELGLVAGLVTGVAMGIVLWLAFVFGGDYGPEALMMIPAFGALGVLLFLCIVPMMGFASGIAGAIIGGRYGWNRGLKKY